MRFTILRTMQNAKRQRLTMPFPSPTGKYFAAFSIHFCLPTWYYSFMEFQLTPEEQNQLQEHGVIEHGKVVMMSMHVYRDMLGIATEEDYADSVNKINEGIGQHEAGKGIPLDEFASNFKTKHGIQG